MLLPGETRWGPFLVPDGLGQRLSWGEVWTLSRPWKRLLPGGGRGETEHFSSWLSYGDRTEDGRPRGGWAAGPWKLVYPFHFHKQFF